MTQEHEPIKLNESTSEPKENGIYLLAITFKSETKTMPLFKDGDEYLGADSSYSWGELVKELSTADEATIQSLSDHDAQIREEALSHADDSTSDGYHTFGELYRYRMLYNAWAVRAWILMGYKVVKSHKHSNGEECFGGKNFVVHAELPTGQVTNHYGNEYWDMFDCPAVETEPEYDGHTPRIVADRLEQSLFLASSRDMATPMSELTEVGKAFAGWVEENSGLAVDENFAYTDRTVGNFACAAFVAGTEWEAQHEPTEAEILAAAFGIFTDVTSSAFVMSDDDYKVAWHQLADYQQDVFLNQAKIALSAARKVVGE